MKRQKFTVTNSLILLTLSASTVGAAGVKSVSREVFNDTETPSWEVTIECDSKAPQRMRQSINGGQWCADDGRCADDKGSLADQLCGASDAENEPPNAAINETERQKLIREQLDIEERKIRIEQKRLELRRQELELQKRQSQRS